MDGISHKVLAESLRDMERAEILAKTVHLETTPRVEYVLSAQGKSLRTHIGEMER